MLFVVDFRSWIINADTINDAAEIAQTKLMEGIKPDIWTVMDADSYDEDMLNDFKKVD